MSGLSGTATLTLTCSGSGNPPTTVTCRGISLGEGAYDIQVQVDPANLYFVSPISDATFAVYVPTGQFVTGGGWVSDPSSLNPKNQANFGFVVRYGKNGQVQGESVYIYRANCVSPGRTSDICDMMIKSNAWIGLGFYTQTVGGVTQQCANFQSKSNVQETDTVNGISYSVEGGDQMTVYACQGNSQTVPTGTNAMQDLNSAGQVFHKTPGYPAGTLLGGGSIVIHNGKYTPTISLSPSSCSAGSTVTLTGTGFAPSSTVTIKIGLATYTVTTTSSGSFTTTITAPSTAGTYTVTPLTAAETMPGLR